MRDAYHAQLDEMHRELREMGLLCEQAVTDAVKAASSGNQTVGERAKEAESRIDRKERAIEALCMRLLLRQQPVAGELREISAALKIITDLERIGDQASDIAELARFTARQSGSVAADLESMSTSAIHMVSGSITALIRHDLSLAREIIAYDDVVDALFDRIKRDLVCAIAKDASDGERYLDVLMVAKYLERIADHATNVAEWAEYAITGRHEGNDGETR